MLLTAFTALRSVVLLLAALGVLLAARPAAGQEFDRASHLIVPQVRAIPMHGNVRGPGPLVIERVAARVAIVEQLARTTIDIGLRNTGARPEEAVILLPVPEGAVVSGLDFEGTASEPTARVLSADEARRTYESIVARTRDPALLEFASYGLLRSSVFPVPAHGTQRLRIVYEHVLAGDGNRVDYVLPRSEALDRGQPWEISVTLDAPHPVSMVYSPSHAVDAERAGPGAFRVRLEPEAAVQPGPFRLSYLLDRGDVSATLFAYPDPTVGGGYFLFTAGLPARLQAPRPPREVTLVLDRSGSMAGGKLDQVRTAALQIIEGLDPRESFNIIDYGSTVEAFSREPVRATPDAITAARAHLERLRPGGGTNIHDALLEALRAPAGTGTVPIVLFLTDGLPTVGKRREADIRAMVEASNPHRRRIHAIGVGTDVNAPLLGRLAEGTRGAVTYVLPDEDLEVKVASVAKRLHGPVFTEPRLSATPGGREPGPQWLREVMPMVLPDVFEGDRLVVLGQYTAEGTVSFALDGTYLGAPRTFTFDFDLDRATTAHAFVPRLWASRKIGYLVDALRQAGADGTSSPGDQELVDEIVRLSTTFGILTEYTAFLATEGTDLGDWANLVTTCGWNVDRRAVQMRSGAAGVSQAVNVEGQKAQTYLNLANTYKNDAFADVATSRVQQMCDRAFFKRGPRWLDAQIATGADDVAPDETITIGSPEHFALARRLAAQNRGGVLALDGELLLLVDGRRILVTAP